MQGATWGLPCLRDRRDRLDACKQSKRSVRASNASALWHGLPVTTAFSTAARSALAELLLHFDHVYSK